MTDSAQPERARAFAELKHGGQQYSGAPYVEHLDDVARLVAAFGLEAQTVAYLHDILEDTATTADEVSREFGQYVADCVALLSDEKDASRLERKRQAHARLADAPSRLELALIVKAADRLANLRASAGEGRESLLRMYCGEHEAFREAVYRPGLCDGLWEEMEEIVS